MEITPASLPQVLKGRRGRRVFVDHDAFDISRRLKEISSDLRLAWNEFGEYFVVYQILSGPNGDTEHLVTTWDPAANGAPDGRLIERIQKIVNPNYDYAAELEAMDKQAKKDEDHAFAEKVGPYSERLFHALQKDLNLDQRRIYVPDIFPKNLKA